MSKRMITLMFNKLMVAEIPFPFTAKLIGEDSILGIEFTFRLDHKHLTAEGVQLWFSEGFPFTAPSIFIGDNVFHELVDVDGKLEMCDYSPAMDLKQLLCNRASSSGL